VLYDITGDYGWLGELHAQMAANLASHFGQVTAVPAGSYTAGRLLAFTAVVYVGTTYDEPLPAALLRDLRTTELPVLWSGLNIWQLSGKPRTTTNDAFVRRYGWDPATSPIDTVDTVSSVTYKGRRLARSPLNRSGLVVPRRSGATPLTILATGQCTSTTAPAGQCRAGEDLPWAVRSANLTYVGENPFAYVSEDDRYLAYADLFFALLAPREKPTRKAAVRLEDVSPTSDPAAIRAFADYLHAAGVPFQIGVIPLYLDPTGALNGGRPQQTPLADEPEVVAALRYAVDRGATLVQHGYTHQYGDVANPYDGVSGDDFEFYLARCSANADPPYQFQSCQTGSWVRLVGALPQDSEDWTAERVRAGRTVLTDAGLSAPRIFETPHYTATAAAYRGVLKAYPTRYERELLFGGALRAGGDPTRSIGQFFPYRVNDVYGGTVLPENLGNFEPLPFNQHPPRLAADLVHNAEANLVVTQSVASFFFHPIYPLADLKATVEGIQRLGYTFVPAEQL
jgi:uncharacterized protein YdaL